LRPWVSSPSVGEALAGARAALSSGDADGRLEAQLLLGHVLGRNRAWLMAHDGDALGENERHRLDALVRRRAAGEPIAYILGRREFWSLDLLVTPAVLVPRADTESLVERALALIEIGRAATVCDLGTGSGAVAIAIARERPRATVFASDASAPALAVAAANVRRLAPGRVALWRGNWLEAVAGACVDLLVSNPPYVAANDAHLARGDLPHEPRDALAAGRDGLDALRDIVAQAPRCLRPGGWLALEHGAAQGATVQALFRRSGFRQVATHRDLGDHERVTAGCLPGAGAASLGL